MEGVLEILLCALHSCSAVRISDDHEHHAAAFRSCQRTSSEPRTYKRTDSVLDERNGRQNHDHRDKPVGRYSVYDDPGDRYFAEYPRGPL